MVVFVDLEDEAEPPEFKDPTIDDSKHQGIDEMVQDRVNINRNTLSAAMGCYP
jgi:hypothetical protein